MRSDCSCSNDSNRGLHEQSTVIVDGHRFSVIANTIPYIPSIL